MYESYRKLKRRSVYDFRDKRRTALDIIDNMLNRTQSIFKYSNLPDTLKPWILELYAQTHGHIAIIETTPNNGEPRGLYGVIGGFSGPPNMYLMPFHYIVSNPNMTATFEGEIDKDVVIMKNDTLMKGLLPIFQKYASLLAENELSIYMSEINMRIPRIIKADNDQAAASAREFLKNIETGKIGVIAEGAFLEGVQTEQYDSNIKMTEFIELEQYIKAAMFNEIGLDANYNMKREAINTTEAQMNDDALIPLIDDMLENRQKALSKIYEIWPQYFENEPTVELAGAWRARQEEIEQIIDDDMQEEDPTSEEKTDESQEDYDNEEDEENEKEETSD